VNRRDVLWVSTSMQSRGGIATYVRTMRGTPLWDIWNIHHVATHRNGSEPTRVGAFLIGVVLFLRELVLQRPAVVHLHTSSYGSFARKSLLAWTARCARVPIVIHVHGAEFDEFYRRLPGFLQRYVRATLESADVVIALGKTWEGRLRQIAPGARIAVIPNAVQPHGRVDQPGPGDPVHVLFLGEIEDRKGSFLLLDAWRRFSDGTQPPGTDLVLAGGGEVARARDQVAALGIGDEVRVPGWVEPVQVEALLESSHVLVLPSRFEGQPMAVLEAMAHGLCVVATDVGGIPDLVVDDVSGVLIPPDDGDALVAALRSVVGDSERRVRLGARAWDRVREEFDVDVTWRQLDALYEELAR
jgi:glycosyltransferase involved in cell wall biosynthesis